MRGVSIGPPSRSGYALRLGAMIRLTSCGGHERCVFAIWILRITSCGGHKRRVSAKRILRITYVGGHNR